MVDSRTPDAIRRRFSALRSELYGLVDDDPEKAICACRELTHDSLLGKRNLDGLRAGVLIDAGIVARDTTAVDEGIHLLEEILNKDPDQLDLQYCLANGLSGRADLVAYTSPQWYLETAEMRRRARSKFRIVDSHVANPEITSRSLTNLANALIKSYRFLEAYDFYLAALQHDPENGVALTGAAKILLHFNNQGIGDENVLLGVTADLLRQARENPERMRELAGAQAVEKLSSLINIDIPTRELPDLSNASPYQVFIATNRLALSPTIEGLDLELDRWDSLSLGSIIEIGRSDSGVPPAFAMFNTIKSDYLAARYIAYLALEGNVAESGNYADTLDYACYGVIPSLLTLAQRASLDILDKIAVAASDYLDLPGSPSSINFRNRWFDKSKNEDGLKWLSQVASEITDGNSALIALAEVSYDIRKEGFLEDKRLKRDTATHRFSVLHDFSANPSRHSEYIDHFDFASFEQHLVETLQLTRAAIFYFVEMVRLREARKDADGSLVMPFDVPDHDWVRGRKD